jgi:CheY-like chemotaxis protein
MTETGMVESLRLEALPNHSRSRPQTVRASTESAPSAPSTTLDRGDPTTSARREGWAQELGGLLIVVVDDDPDTVDYFVVALRACGATVLSASTAASALALIEDRSPDVILSDIAMAVHDGYWLVKEVRRRGESGVAAIPAIAVTAYGREHSRERSLAAGFNDHLRKPVDPEVLCRAIARAAGR